MVGGDTLGTIWSADAHTLAKIDILKSYLKAWMPILTRQVAQSGRGGEVRYVDAFAGPGVYEGGEPGSPLAAIEVAVEHAQQFPVPVRLSFVEKDEARYKELVGQLRKCLGPRRNSIVDGPICGSAEQEVKRILGLQAGSYTPTLVFLDQFGYSAVPMSLIRRVLSGPSCEVLSFMNWRDLNRYVADESKWAGITRAFGGDEWKEIIGLDGQQKSRRFLELYDAALRDRAQAKYSCSFAMHDRDGQLIYWLIFCGNNDRGLEEMKGAMWSVDSSGRFRFSDKHSGQLSLLKGFDDEWLSNRLSVLLLGREMSVGEIKHFVLTETPCYQFSEALRRLERNGELVVVSAPPERRKGTFKKYANTGTPELIVRFQRAETQGSLPL